jgi:hypothetical protein
MDRWICGIFSKRVNRFPFEIFITNDTIQDETEKYEFTLQRTKPDGSEDSRRVLGQEDGVSLVHFFCDTLVFKCTLIS